MSENWNYFTKDPSYSKVLRDRLSNGVEMDSAKAMSVVMAENFDFPLDIIDFGGGPGHYYTVFDKYLTNVRSYTSVDIDADNVEYGQEFWEKVPKVKVILGSVLSPTAVYGQQNCVISANTLPHVPSVVPLLEMMERNSEVKCFCFRMLVGMECVQIKKNLDSRSYTRLFEDNYQHNNIYSEDYLVSLLPSFAVTTYADIFSVERMKDHQETYAGYSDQYKLRVSRLVSGNMIFKGDVYMPWKIVIGMRR